MLWKFKRLLQNQLKGKKTSYRCLDACFIYYSSRKIILLQHRWSTGEPSRQQRQAAVTIKLGSLGQLRLCIGDAGVNASVPTRLTQKHDPDWLILTQFTKKASDAKCKSDNFENDTEKIVGSSCCIQFCSHVFANTSENSIWTLPHPVIIMSLIS